MISLRYKFGLLALLYAITLAANVALCSWCLLLYYQSFIGHAAAEPLELAEMTGPTDLGELTEPAAREVRPPGVLAERDGGAGLVFLNERYVARILAVNAVCGVGLGILGLRLVRRWVLLPVAGLREAALELGRGKLDFRAKATSRDELGELASEVNAMASSIVRMQNELLQQERRQVAAQALRCIVHNIRSPLTGIRWLAEAVSMRDDVDPDTAREQGLIMQDVDGIMSWLKSFRERLEPARHDTCPADTEAVESGSGPKAFLDGQHSDR